MRLGILILTLITVLFGSSYWFSIFDYACKVPIHYRIGVVDERFDTSPEELRRIAARAEAVWEKPLNAELFVYDEHADFPINLVFDERQQNADIEAELREDLDAKEGMNEAVARQYEQLITEFRGLKKSYEAQVIAYESKLTAYNGVVADWNAQGGAPESVIQDLRTTAQELTREQKKLEETTQRLNTLVTQLNDIGARGNSLATDYNTIVEEYNAQFNEVKEFAQGDYTGEGIHVYQFDSEEELVIVLAHEFGHALSLDHVENEKSIMYHFMEDQSLGSGVSEEDTAEYGRVCSNKNIFLRGFIFFQNLW